VSFRSGGPAVHRAKQSTNGRGGVKGVGALGGRTVRPSCSVLAKLLEFCLVAMEACAGSHYGGRRRATRQPLHAFLKIFAATLLATTDENTSRRPPAAGVRHLHLTSRCRDHRAAGRFNNPRE